MYKSPITIIESTIDNFNKDIIKQKDGVILAEIQSSFGVDVDRNELIRALQYDRDQYNKGYADAKPKWIPVAERLPEKGADVLCSRGNHIGALMDVYTYKGDNKWQYSRGYWNYGDIEGITHWMPLPELPKGE